MITLFKRSWRWFTRPGVLIGQGYLLMIGGVAGILFRGGFNTAMEATNTMESCMSCHAMRDTVHEEDMTSVHCKMASGVRAICSDCHVPHEGLPKMVRTVQASNDIHHTLMGSIDTPEKFGAKRLQPATHVRETMKAHDSHECRNCHSWDAMDFDNQRDQMVRAFRADFDSLIARRFDEWGLTAAERDVARVSLRGLRIAEIVQTRQPRDGTVKAQISAAVHQAGVGTRAGFLALFMDEFVDSGAKSALVDPFDPTLESAAALPPARLSDYA